VLGFTAVRPAVVVAIPVPEKGELLQHPDGRVVFAIPFEEEFTLIGTTDHDYHGDTDTVAIDAEEISYLCELTSRYFRKMIVPADVVWSYSGVRPLVEDDASDAAAVTRDYRFELEHDGAPMLSVFGGKITTFRKLAEEAVDMVAPALSNRHGRWTVCECRHDALRARHRRQPMESRPPSPRPAYYRE